MQRTLEESNIEQGAEVNQAIRELNTGKPYLRFNSDFKICDCNDQFLSDFKISKKELLKTDLTQHARNNQLIKAISKAVTAEIATYHGKIYLDESLSGIYIEALLIKSKPGKQEGNEIYFYIIEKVFPAAENKTEKINVGSETALPAYNYASVSVHSSDGSALYISPSVESLLGYTHAEIKALSPLYLVYPEDLPLVRNVIEKLKSGSDFLNTRYRMIHKNGSIVFVESTSYILRDSSGKANHIVNITWDLGSKQGIEHALHISEQKYYRLVMNLPIGVSLISANGKLLEANEAMKKIMHVPANVPIPEIDFLNIEGMKRSGISAQFSKCIVTKDTVNGEVQLQLSSRGRETYLIYSFVPIIGNNEEVESVIGYVNDLTYQKKAESESRERADFLDLVINTIKTPFFVKDQDHRWVMLNDAAIEMMGHPRESLLKKSDYDLFPKAQADIFWKYDELVFKSGSSSNEEQITWSDGTIHTIVTHKQLYVEKASGKKYIVGTIHDITSYKKIEAELRASETKYRELFDNANDFIITTDIDGNITNANLTFLRYLQTDLASLSKHNVFEYIREENIDFAKDIKEKILSGVSGYSFEVKAFGPEGQDVIYEVKASLISHNNVPMGVQCVLSDVTARREASLKLEKFNASLLELNNTKDKFFSIIAHDLRNPYSSMLGFAEMLLEDLDDLTKDEIRDSLKIIYGSAKNSLNLLENLLAWSRLETGHMPFTPTQLILSDIVEEVVNVLFSNAYRKKIDINNLVDPNVKVFADKNMLNTILNNLIMNAIKFTQSGGEIKINAVSKFSDQGSGKNFVKISVSDTGIGMDPETSTILFTSNRLISNPGTEREQGSGLGLLLTREMVEKHGGRIMVESTPGKGSVFSFLIPA